MKILKTVYNIFFTRHHKECMSFRDGRCEYCGKYQIEEKLEDVWRWSGTENEKNVRNQIEKNKISSVVFEILQKRGAEIIMNGDWFDCNKCGAIIYRGKAVGDSSHKNIDMEIINKHGAICQNCYDVFCLKKSLKL